MELTTKSGVPLEIGEEIGRGGRGSVYLLSGGRRVAKVFKENSRTKRRQGKVACEKALSKACDASVAWPIDDVFENGAWAGYTMERVFGRGLDEVSHDEGVSFFDRACYAREMAEIVDDLHRCDVVMGDVSLSNFVVSWGRRGKVVAIDPDSFQVKDDEEGVCYPTTESREKSPEMLERGDLGDYFLTSLSDDFLLASAIFELLLGVHPLDGGQSDMPPSLSRRTCTEERTFAFLDRPGASLESVGRDLEALFVRSFMGDAKKVPSAYEYAEALDDLIRNMIGDGGDFLDGKARRAAKVVGVVFPALLAILHAAVLLTEYDLLWVDSTYLEGMAIAYAGLAVGSSLSKRWFPFVGIAATVVLLANSDATALCIDAAPVVFQQIFLDVGGMLTEASESARAALADFIVALCA